MAEKLQILNDLGEVALLLPGQLNRGLAANDAIKYLMTLVQTAAHHADAPNSPAPDLSVERLTAGVSDARLDQVVAGSHRVGEAYRIPQAATIYAQMRDDLAVMLEPLRTASASDSSFDAAPYAARLDRIAPVSTIEDDFVPAAWIAESTRVERSAGDSIHLLVMDLHRELNRLQAAITPELLDGAAAYGLGDGDAARVRAFMAGLNRTGPLKFDHPGLGTTATRVGDALVLQNDIGTTDTHVLVVRVVRRLVTVTYTDIHVERADFFRSLFDPFEARWTQAGGQIADWSTEGAYVLLTGRYQASDDDELDRFLAFLGSRIVFLIDWNRARRALRLFVRNRDAVEILQWAAAEELGHRALIQLGGAQIIADAVDQAAPQPLPYGKRLDEVLGRDATVQYLRSVLRVTSRGLRAGHSERLIRDEIRSELARRFRSIEEQMVDIVAEHLLVVSDLANAARASIVYALTETGATDLDGLARRAKIWEQAGDALVVAARRAEVQSPGEAFFGPLLSTQDDVADALDDVVFLASLLSTASTAGPSESLGATLQSAGELLVRGTRGLVKCTATAAAILRDGTSEDTRDFLEAVDEVVGIEHEGDDLDREFTIQLMGGSTAPHQLHLLNRLSEAIEEALDAMSHTALALHDHLIEAQWAQR